MSFFPLASSLFDSSVGHAALDAELAVFAAHALREDGYVYPRFGMDAYVTMSIHDQMGHFLVSGIGGYVQFTVDTEAVGVAFVRYAVPNHKLRAPLS